MNQLKKLLQQKEQELEKAQQDLKKMIQDNKNLAERLNQGIRNQENLINSLIGSVNTLKELENENETTKR